MPINKFKITVSPLRASILIETVEHVLNQEYSIDKQDDIDIVTTDVGVPYDEFKYQLGADDGSFSPDIVATIDVNVNAGTPAATALDFPVKGNEYTDITSDITFDDKTDRFKFIPAVSFTAAYGDIYINDEILELNRIYFLYELGTIKFLSNHSETLQNPNSLFKLQRGNKDGFSASANVDIESSANLKGITGFDPEAAEEVQQPGSIVTGKLNFTTIHGGVVGTLTTV